MNQASEDTCFAPPERSDAATVERQHELVAGRGLLTVLDAVPVIAMVLNRQRQVVCGNRRFRAATGIGDLRQALGQRPGEAFGCERAATGKAGCGTSEFCVHCGAVRSILLGLAGRENMRECTLTSVRTGTPEVLELLVSSSPLDVGGETFLVFSVTDVSHEKRRRALERIFFHDMLNTVGGLKGLMSLLAEEVPATLRADTELARQALEQLIEEIDSQKQLLAAETNVLRTEAVALFADELLTVVGSAFQNADVGRDRHIALRQCHAEAPLVTDPVLLRRVLGNLVKNALEATDPGGRVTLGCEKADDALTFYVHNEAVIPGSIQARIFSRSFSTKGEGRGLGTHGARLLAERYLGGTVSFTSRAGEGTVFRVRLPLATSLADG